MQEQEAARVRASIKDERGQGLIEYVLIIAIVSLGAVVSLGFVSGKINTLFSKAGNSLNTVTIAAGGGGGGGGSDTTAPTLTISSPANGATGVSMNPTYTGTCGTAAGDLPTITINVAYVSGPPDNQAPYGPFTTSCAAGSWSFTHPGPGGSQGLKNNRTYQVTASQSDSSGNIGSRTNQFST